MTTPTTTMSHWKVDVDKRGMKDNWIRRSNKWNSFFYLSLHANDFGLYWNAFSVCLLHFHFAPFSPINPRLNILPTTRSDLQVFSDVPSPHATFLFSRLEGFTISIRRRLGQHLQVQFNSSTNWWIIMLCVAWIVIPQTLTLVKLNNKEIMN